MNIFNISRELEDIFYQIEENGGEITSELEEKLRKNKNKAQQTIMIIFI